ncbi:zinc-binding alcohol dehydrogenase [Streptomyces viridiviolaceus]|uniref:2-deoxy-scyllo-inosamine dehydrogenase n=1 Tax=Streptomyces viridiviolaceus TaxID=68282 RepID=A0ABW2EC81_9ACTN|nr:zinc-binding dehydrogenase [Streptomyces viridiviolaceus]GHB73281.1 zinc-binding alcohol dehydrogenase [Streptomyces viridiviolaceus]
MTQTGRAALFYGPGKPFKLTELPVPEPEPGALVMRVTRANICGSDLHIWSGEGALAAGGRDDGRVIGHEMTGVVHSLGPGVDRDWAGEPLAPGDRIVCQYFAPCGRCRPCLHGRAEACTQQHRAFQGKPSVFPHFRGAFADYFYVRPTMAVFKVPDRVGDVLAAGVNCALAQMTMAFERAQVKMGDRVVIQGAGGLGLYATALARECGASQVVVVDGVDERLELARGMGADEVVDFRELGSAEARAARVRDLTDGGGDVVFELVGRPGAIEEGLRMVARGGRYLELGTFYQGTTTAIDPGYLVMNNITLQAVAFYDAHSLKKALTFLERHADDLPLGQAAADYPLEAIDTALADQHAGKVARGSLVMT